jgi:hypothetical protein
MTVNQFEQGLPYANRLTATRAASEFLVSWPMTPPRRLPSAPPFFHQGSFPTPLPRGTPVPPSPLPRGTPVPSTAPTSSAARAETTRTAPGTPVPGQFVFRVPPTPEPIQPSIETIETSQQSRQRGGTRRQERTISRSTSQHTKEASAEQERRRNANGFGRGLSEAVNGISESFIEATKILAGVFRENREAASSTGPQIHSEILEDLHKQISELQRSHEAKVDKLQRSQERQAEELKNVLLDIIKSKHS